MLRVPRSEMAAESRSPFPSASPYTLTTFDHPPALYNIMVLRCDAARILEKWQTRCHSLLHKEAQDAPLIVSFAGPILMTNAGPLYVLTVLGLHATPEQVLPQPDAPNLNLISHTFAIQMPPPNKRFEVTLNIQKRDLLHASIATPDSVLRAVELIPQKKKDGSLDKDPYGKVNKWFTSSVGDLQAQYTLNFSDTRTVKTITDWADESRESLRASLAGPIIKNLAGSLYVLTVIRSASQKTTVNPSVPNNVLCAVVYSQDMQYGYGKSKPMETSRPPQESAPTAKLPPAATRVPPSDKDHGPSDDEHKIKANPPHGPKDHDVRMR